MLPRSTPLVALLLAVSAGCSARAGSATNENVRSAEQHAWVTPDDAQTAYGIIQNIGYLPFAYKEDGCYARALYMSMELAASGIPSSAQFITGQLHPTADITWTYHVAPMVQLIGDDHRTIVDPSMETGPVPFDNWVTDVNPAPNYATFFVPGSVYIGSLNLTHPEQYNGPMIESFDELPPFHESDIQQACQVMWNYLDWEQPPRDDLRPVLIARTQELMPLLDDRGKMADYTQGDTVNCAVPMDP